MLEFLSVDKDEEANFSSLVGSFTDVEQKPNFVCLLFIELGPDIQFLASVSEILYFKLGSNVSLLALISKTFYSECSRAAATPATDQGRAVSLSSVLLNAISPAGQAGRYVCISTSLAGWLAGRARSNSLCFVRSNINGRAGTTGPGNQPACLRWTTYDDRYFARISLDFLPGFQMLTIKSVFCDTDNTIKTASGVNV